MTNVTDWRGYAAYRSEGVMPITRMSIVILVFFPDLVWMTGGGNGIAGQVPASSNKKLRARFPSSISRLGASHGPEAGEHSV